MTTIAVLIGFVSLFPGSSQSDIDDIVSKTKQKLEATTTATISFTQTSSGNTQSGTLQYSTGNRFRLVLPQQTIVSNGSKTWTYIRSRNQVVINKGPVSGQVTLNDIIRSFPGDYDAALLGSTTVGGRNVWKVRCTSSGSNRVGDISTATLYIDKSTYRARKISIASSMLGNMTITITSASYNKSIPSSRFSFTAPDGADIIDLTD